MARIGKRPRWKRMLYIEYLAIHHKREIILEGYLVILLGLTSLLWCWILLPWVYLSGQKWVLNRIERSRRAPYGGINIAESNTATQRTGWVRRRRTFSREAAAGKTDLQMTGSPLLRLPEEIRREIVLHLVRPANELTICAMNKERRLVALPTHTWDDAHADARGSRQQWQRLLNFLRNSVTDDASNHDPYTCRDMLTLAKANRSLYREVIPMLYRENVFNFHPIESMGCTGSVEHFLAFTKSIPTARLNDLRHIRLLVNFDFFFDRKRQNFALRGDGEYRWSNLCERLNRMENLLTLHIHVNRRPYQMGSVQRGKRQSVQGEAPEKRILRQLVGVKARRECFVEVPWLRSVVGELPGAEFELREAEGAADAVNADER